VEGVRSPHIEDWRAKLEELSGTKLHHPSSS
jgi:hypothetical protein